MTTETVYQVYLQAYYNRVCGQVFQVAPDSALTLYAAAALGAAHANERGAEPISRYDVERHVSKMCEART